MLQHLESRGDHYFDRIGLTVDVFHFKCKHKTTHQYCRDNCDPAAYPELCGTDNAWFFNSSIAEQNNVWLAGYNAMCREMTPYRFNFFLDEMIIRRNRAVIAALERKGFMPHYLDASE